MKQAMIWTKKPDPGRTNFSRKMSLSAFGAVRRRLAEKMISRDVEMQLSWGCQVDKGYQRDSETVE